MERTCEQANLLNWLHDGKSTSVADFEFSGFSDIAVDAADHIEHISALVIPDEFLPLGPADQVLRLGVSSLRGGGEACGR